MARVVFLTHFGLNPNSMLGFSQARRIRHLRIKEGQGAAPRARVPTRRLGPGDRQATHRLRDRPPIDPST